MSALYIVNDKYKPIDSISSLTPEEHKKGWGSETWYVNNERYCLKKLSFKKGEMFSLHFHVKKWETWVILSGSFILDYIDLVTAERISANLKPGDIIDVPPNNPHRLIATTDGEVLEVSTQHFEQDSYRIEPGSSQR